MASASKESGSSWSVRALLAGAVGAMIVSAPIAARAADSELPDAIKAVTGDTGPQTQWTGRKPVTRLVGKSQSLTEGAMPTDGCQPGIRHWL